MRLHCTDGIFFVEATDPEGISARMALPGDGLDIAKDPGAMARIWREQLGKLGATEFRADSVILV